MEIVFDETIEMKDNALLRHHLTLFNEWDFEKNDELGLDVYKVTKGSGKLAWWVCSDCKSSYDTIIGNRAGSKQVGCPFCGGSRVNCTNSLASLRPDIASQWHPSLNGDLTPHDRTHGSNQKVWWLGECGHEWDAPITRRTGKEGSSCPYCSGMKTWIGFNDMWTTNPELAKQLLNPEDGHKYTQFSNVKVDWKCISCSEAIKNKQINTINQRGFSCSRCSDGLRFPEKFMYNLLRESNIEFEFNKKQIWSQETRYDFFFEFKNEPYIVETHGVQHYGRGFSGARGRTLEEEQENDRLKEQLAKESGIVNYIVIDVRESTVEWISNSILNSNLKKIIKNIDLVKIGQLSSKSLIKEACDLWMSGIKSASRIAEVLKLSSNTIGTYLKRGAEIGWCDYCPEEAMRKGARIANKMKRKPVVQLDKDLLFVKHWESGIEVKINLGVSDTTIGRCCKGKQKIAGGFKWMYKTDYDKMLSEGLSHEEYMTKYYPKN